MQTRLSLDSAASHTTPLLAIPVFRDEAVPGQRHPALDRRTGRLLERALEAGDFEGRDEQELLLYADPVDGGEGEGPGRILFIGAGKRDEAEPDLYRRIAGRTIRRAETLRIAEVSLSLAGALPDGIAPGAAVQAAAEGLVLAAWNFRELHSSPSGDDEREPARVEMGTLLIEWDDPGLEEARRIGTAFAEGENLARDLQSRPGNIATPSHLAEIALGLADSLGFEATILGPDEMEAEGMGALLSVARGSDEEPRLIVLEHRGGGEGERPLALVGKGLTFDTGGISIKPASGMEDMKFDMSGGAAVLGAMHAIGTLALPVNVVAVVPSSENLINGSANKPGDVVRARSGKTIEIINTDAEGRLILADALSWVIDHHRPTAIVDCATLTGACVVALGHHAAAVLGTDEALVEELRIAGDRASERCWPLPLWKPYRKQLESTFADLKNVGGRPAGAITAAWFLSEFTGDTSWAHLDIAGTAYGESEIPYRRSKGAFGFPTRLLLEWVRGRAG